ncbi:TetR/AcrR family transcriptional regulator [Streptomyces mexicanus]|uniref:TetR/AcrR family transcriptional regulator n=1 Tax=Streptomyces mexicanus TaxID=178566 RepID=A0A7X1LPK7_9ACTN|nr:TetR/AcrR family transcriptional regulator [Streptomyces mexicanus]MBC2864983.1 TetR/AcrR family transcriptional regulator [Streptomyces mexicanus]
MVAMRSTRQSTRRAEILTGLVEIFLNEGFLDFSLEDLAVRLQCSKSTLYVVAPSKEQLIVAVVRAFFREATDRVEERVTTEPDPVKRIGVYLDAISRELAPASSKFFADLSSFAPAHEIYLHNTAIATRRVQELVAAAEPSGHTVNAVFLGAVAGTVMESIQRGELGATTSLTDAEAYRLLADLIVAGVTKAPGARRAGGTHEER